MKQETKTIIHSMLFVTGSVVLMMYFASCNSEASIKDVKTPAVIEQNIDNSDSNLNTESTTTEVIVEDTSNDNQWIPNPNFATEENSEYKSFSDIYKYMRDNLGEGTTFYWYGNEYVVSAEQADESEYDLFSFPEAFALARESQGPCSDFSWQGQRYSACLDTDLLVEPSLDEDSIQITDLTGN